MYERKPPLCGTANAYNHGCRCDLCKAHHAQRCAKQKRARLQRPVPESVHGSQGGYANWDCRCDLCTTAHRHHCQEQQQRRKLREPPSRIHGTHYGYSKWGCRCRPCSAAASEYRRVRTERHA